MFYSMNTFASSSNNPYARKYITKGRKSSDSCVYLDANKYLMEPKTKKIKRGLTQINYKQHKDNSEIYNLFNDDNNEIHNDFSEFYEYNLDFDRSQTIPCDNYSYLNQNISDENSGLVDDAFDKYSIDFLEEEADNVVFDSFIVDPPLYNGCALYSDKQFETIPCNKSKRKQGIVGRPTLKSPQRLLVPDNVYSHGTSSDVDINYFTDNNHRPRSNRKRQSELHEESPSRRNSSRSRPRILLKPSVSEYRDSTNIASFNNLLFCDDANDVAQRLVANREFARNLVARAERQGTLVDKNKIPMSLFEEETEETASTLLDGRSHGRAVAEVRKVPQDVKRPTAPPVVTVATPIPRRPAVTASDLLKQKWRAASRPQPL